MDLGLDTAPGSGKIDAVASNFELACRRIVLGAITLPLIFFGARYAPWLLHLGDKEPWVETRHDPISFLLPFHGIRSESYLHVGGKVFWIASSYPPYLELPGIGAVLVRRQIDYSNEELLLVYKGSGEEVRFETVDYRLSYLGGTSVVRCDSKGFVLMGNGFEHHFDLTNRTQSGLRMDSTDSEKK